MVGSFFSNSFISAEFIAFVQNTMEVDDQSIWAKMPEILTAIGRAKFVSIDLEMSGISCHPLNSRHDRSRDSGKPTLQQQYEESKEAAEKYQVLQGGITCLEEDRVRGTSAAHT